MNRRTFLATMTAATLLSSRLGWTRSGERKLDKIGLELYTVRDMMKSDFEGTLAKVAEIGYREVEFNVLFDDTTLEVLAMLDGHWHCVRSSAVMHALLDTTMSKS